MSDLDGMFRESLAAARGNSTSEGRARVVQAVAVKATRRRRVHAVAVGAVAVIGTVLVASGAYGVARLVDPPVAGVPTPSVSVAPSPTPTPAIARPDARFPAAPVVADVSATTRAWTLETIAYPGDAGTSDVAFYLAPPGGTRQLALFVPALAQGPLYGHGWYPQGHTALVGGGGKVFSVDLVTGAVADVTPTETDLGGAAGGITYLGQGYDDAPLIAADVTADGLDLQVVLGWSPAGWAFIWAEQGALGAISPTTPDAIEITSIGAAVVDLHVGRSTLVSETTKGCTFARWLEDSHFALGCDNGTETPTALIGTVGQSTLVEGAFTNDFTVRDGLTGTGAAALSPTPIQLLGPGGGTTISGLAVLEGDVSRQVLSFPARPLEIPGTDLVGAHTWAVTFPDAVAPILVDTTTATATDLSWPTTTQPTSYAIVLGS